MTTGWPASELMQDDSRELSRALANMPHARLHAREAAGAIRKLSHYTRIAVETSAEAAARENRTPLEACPYRADFAPLEYAHWHAVFILHGGIEPLAAMARASDDIGEAM